MADGSESELERFRKRWREDISRRATHQINPRQGYRALDRSKHSVAPPPPSHAYVVNAAAGASDDSAPQTYHDLEDKEERLKLGNPDSRETIQREPQSALELYENAVEKETAGRMGESVSLYRRAFKLDAKVHEIYKQKHFPTSLAQAKQASTNAHIDQTKAAAAKSTQPASTMPTTITEMLNDFSRLSISPAEPETDLSPPPPCPIASLPQELLSKILRLLAEDDLTSFTKLAQVCKRFAYLTITEDRIWKSIALGEDFGFAAMLYRYACDLAGRPILDERSNPVLDVSHAHERRVIDMTPELYATYRSQFRTRPRIRYNGCYISTVNYTRPGLSHQSQYNWNSPVLIVTYYRYLRFFRDGTVISLLTTAEPADVVHHLKKENLGLQHSNHLPVSVMKDALRGRWRLTGPTSGPPEIQLDPNGVIQGPGEYAKEPTLEGSSIASDELEVEGTLNIETEGISPKYLWKMELAIGSAGRKDGTRNNKLSWKGFWSYNRLTDDWAEFGLKNDRAFYYSRVTSYGSSS